MKKIIGIIILFLLCSCTGSITIPVGLTTDSPISSFNQMKAVLSASKGDIVFNSTIDSLDIKNILQENNYNLNSSAAKYNYGIAIDQGKILFGRYIYMYAGRSDFTVYQSQDFKTVQLSEFLKTAEGIVEQKSLSNITLPRFNECNITSEIFAQVVTKGQLSSKIVLRSDKDCSLEGLSFDLDKDTLEDCSIWYKGFLVANLGTGDSVVKMPRLDLVGGQMELTVLGSLGPFSGNAAHIKVELLNARRGVDSKFSALKDNIYISSQINDKDVKKIIENNGFKLNPTTTDHLFEINIKRSEPFNTIEFGICTYKGVGSYSYEKVLSQQFNNAELPGILSAMEKIAMIHVSNKSLPLWNEAILRVQLVDEVVNMATGDYEAMININSDKYCNLKGLPLFIDLDSLIDCRIYFNGLLVGEVGVGEKVLNLPNIDLTETVKLKLKGKFRPFSDSKKPKVKVSL